MATSVLAWRIPGMGEPGGLLSMGLHRVRHDWSSLAAAAAVTICSDFGAPRIKSLTVSIVSLSIFHERMSIRFVCVFCVIGYILLLPCSHSALLSGSMCEAVYTQSTWLPTAGQGAHACTLCIPIHSLSPHSPGTSVVADQTHNTRMSLIICDSQQTCCKNLLELILRAQIWVFWYWEWLN